MYLSYYCILEDPDLRKRVEVQTLHVGTTTRIDSNKTYKIYVLLSILTRK